MAREMMRHHSELGLAVPVPNGFGGSVNAQELGRSLDAHGTLELSIVSINRFCYRKSGVGGHRIPPGNYSQDSGPLGLIA